MNERIDPICGMEGNIEAHEHYFCSRHCVDEYEKKHSIKSESIKGKGWHKAILYGVSAGLVAALIVLLQLFEVMIPFMGGFFIAVAILKFLDWKGFANAFAMYDIVAKKIKVYAYAYPVIELGLGLGFIFAWHIPVVAVITLIIMVVGSIGVAKNLFSKNPVKCACLGTVIKIPLTKFTFGEDIAMAAMALMILVV